MNNLNRIRIAVILATMLIVYLPISRADIDCRGNAVQNEKRLAEEYRKSLSKAESAERAGKLKEAETLLLGTHFEDLGCAGDFYKESATYTTMLKRVTTHLGQQAEKQGKLAEAFDYYDRSSGIAIYQINSAGKFDFSKPAAPSYTDAERVKMKQVNASPHDRKLIGDAMAYFKGINNKERVTGLQQLALKNADLELANEEKAFAARKESFTELDIARSWLYLTGDQTTKKVRERAERRGDTLLSQEDTLRHLENARRYFDFAEAKQKIKAVKDKAMRLAQEHEKKGETNQARDFYSLAGASDKGNALQERSDVQHQKSEQKRQKQFTKGQGDLEKELGL